MDDRFLPTDRWLAASGGLAGAVFHPFSLKEYPTVDCKKWPRAGYPGFCLSSQLLGKVRRKGSLSLIGGNHLWQYCHHILMKEKKKRKKGGHTVVFSMVNN